LIIFFDERINLKIKKLSFVYSKIHNSEEVLSIKKEVFLKSTFKERKKWDISFKKYLRNIWKKYLKNHTKELLGNFISKSVKGSILIAQFNLK